MVSDSERTKILEMIETGTITAEEGMTLLNVLSESSFPEAENDYVDGLPENISAADSETELSDVLPGPDGEHLEIEFDESEMYAGEVEVLPEQPKVEALGSEEINKWKRWWVIPLWIGAGITVLGGLLMFWAYRANDFQFGFWFACAWFPFLSGVGLLALAWGSRTTPWLHVRVHQKPGESPQKIAISFPIPIRLTAWGLRTFGHFIPHMDGTSLDEVILALKDISTDEAPLFVDVDEGEYGEKVQVFIG